MIRDSAPPNFVISSFSPGPLVAAVASARARVGRLPACLTSKFWCTVSSVHNDFPEIKYAGENFWLRIHHENIKGEQMLHVLVIILLKMKASLRFPCVDS